MQDKFFVIEQGVDMEFIQKGENYPQNESDIYTFLYAGIFYKYGINPKNLFDSFTQVRKECLLSLYGNIKKELRSYENNRINYHSSVDKDQLAKITTSANALIILDNDYGYQVFEKTLETLSVGTPFLFIYNNDKSPTLKYVKEVKGL